MLGQRFVPHAILLASLDLPAHVRPFSLLHLTPTASTKPSKRPACPSPLVGYPPLISSDASSALSRLALSYHSALNKEIVALASATNPSSPTHSLPGRSTIRLLELATKILALAQRTIALFDTNKNKVGKSLHADMELGEKGCLRERKAKAMPGTKGRNGGAGGRKAKRPAMGRDDGRDYGDDEEDYENEEEGEDEGVVGGKMPGGMDRVEE